MSVESLEDTHRSELETWQSYCRREGKVPVADRRELQVEAFDRFALLLRAVRG